jgi:hypothetical protein
MPKSRKMSRKYYALLKKKNASHLSRKGGKKTRYARKHKGDKKIKYTRKHKGGMGWRPPPPHHTHPIDWYNPPHSFFPPHRGGSCGKTHKKRKQKGGSAGWNGPAGGAPGFSWWSNPGTWPGVAASMGQSQNGMTQSNHLPLSKYGIPAGVGGEGGPNDPPVSTRNANAGPNNGGTAYQNANNGQPGPPLTNIDIMKQKA